MSGVTRDEEVGIAPSQLDNEWSYVFSLLLNRYYCNYSNYDSRAGAVKRY